MTLVDELEPDGDVVALATTVALAPSVDSALLREVRIVLHPGLDPGAEADLWFSALVEVGGPRGFVLAADVLDELRSRLADDQPLLERAWQVTSRVHAGIAPILRIEAELTYQGLCRPRDTQRIDTLLGSVLDAMSADAQRAPRLARWLTRAAPRWPASVRERESAWKVVLRGSLHARGLASLVEAALPAHAQQWLEDVLPADPPRRWLAAHLWQDHLELGPELTAHSLPVHVPDTEPAIVTVSAPGRPAVQVPVRSDATVVVGLSPAGASSRAGPCFISYVGAEGERAARALADALASGTPAVPAWVDVLNLRSADRWEDDINKAIDGCRALLFVLTRESVKSGSAAEHEWQRALRRRTQVVSLRFDPEAKLPEGLLPSTVIDFSGSFEDGLAALRARLAEHTDDREEQPGDEPHTDATVELRTAGGDLHRLHRQWTLTERVRAYADVLHVIGLAFHVGALAPEGERADPAQFGREVLRDPKGFEAVQRSAEWAMSSVRDGAEGAYSLDWVEPLLEAGVGHLNVAGDVAGAAGAYLSALGEFLRYRLEQGDFDWQGRTAIAPQTRPFLELNFAGLEVEVVERPQTPGEPMLSLRGRYSSFVELFDRCADGLVGALRWQQQTPDADDLAARDDTLRRLVRFWPLKTVGEHTEADLGSTGRGAEPAYIRRDADAGLERTLAAGPRLVIVTGPAMSGYKRTALEGLRRAFNDSLVYVPVDARALARLSVEPVVPELRGTVVWLAHLERFLGNAGLTPATLDGLLSRTAADVVLATIERGELAGRRPEIEPLEPAVIEIQRELSEAERASVAQALPDAYEVIVNEGLVRYFAGETTDPEAVGRRIRQSLANPQFRWRTVTRVAREAGVSEDDATMLLRSDSDVQLSRNREGKLLAGLRWRVGDSSSESPNTA
jgi:hypothetical protein